MADSVRRELTISGSPAEVWAALTDPGQLSSWFGAEVEIDARPGGPVRFRWPDGIERRGLVETVDPPRRLVFRWRELRALGTSFVPGEATTVAFDLEPTEDGGTRLVVTESVGLFAEAAP
jgi:uncharacterized protein YndB with AHSA1/START domain